MLTDEEIEAAKARTRYSLSEGPHHEHNDCIRIAYEWLDAQAKLKAPNARRSRPLKHIIEKWGGRYVSTTDVDVAAELHPDVHGRYPHFNISSRLTRPSDVRLSGIGEAFSQGYRERFEETIYATAEPDGLSRDVGRSA